MSKEFFLLIILNNSLFMDATVFDDSIKLVLGMFADKSPSDVVMSQTIESRFRKSGLGDRYFPFIMKLLINNQYLSDDKFPMIRLTDHGYALLHDDIHPKFDVDLFGVFNSEKDRRKLFYNIWSIVGEGTDETNPFYISGRAFYDEIKLFIAGLPSSYTQYMHDLEETKGKGIGRSKWCLGLFMMLKDEQVEPFLIKLSSRINSRNYEEEKKDIEELPIIEWDIKEPKEMKEPKIFISHNTKDKDFAKALVDMMLNLGVDEEYIFCSSYPGFGVPYGKNIFDYIKEQYEQYDLLVLFIHSPRYYESHISLNEMGAAWVLRSEHRSFLTKDCEFNQLDGVINSDEAAFKAGKEDTYHYLNDFKELLVEKFHLERKPDTRWDVIKKDFLDEIIL